MYSYAHASSLLCQPPANMEPSSKKIKTEEEENKQDLLAYFPPEIQWRKIKRTNLDLDYARIFPAKYANAIFTRLEQETRYHQGQLARTMFRGKWYDLRRKHASYGDEGINYSFSGMTLPALPWTHLLTYIRSVVKQACGVDFNFVLVNRYDSGKDYLGYHRDDEDGLDKTKPIVSLSFGQARPFLLKPILTGNAPPLELLLENGSMLSMNPPTNEFWLHSLPRRQRVVFPRINLTFRCIIIKK